MKNTGRLQLLIVDDEEGHVEAIRRAFDEAGGQVDIQGVGTLREYRARIASAPPDIALLDLNLPDGTAVEALAQPPENAPFPVLVMTAYGTQQLVVDVLKAGALDYVVKSAEVFAAMPHTVERVLREWKLLQRHKQAEAALRESETMYRSLFDSSRDALLTLAPPAWKFVSGNPAALALFGAGSQEEFTPATPADLSPERQPDGRLSVEKAGEMIAAALRDGFSSFEWTYKRHSGGEFFATVLLTRIEIGEKRFLQVTVRDITERKQAEAEREALQAQFLHSQKMASVGRLAGGVAHDFNNLLTAITCYAGFLRKGLAEGRPKSEDVDEIMGAAERAAGLTRQLLAFSRKQMLSPKVIDLNTSVGGMVQLLKRLLGEDIRLETRLAARACQVKVDHGQFDQVIVNLAVNARDAMPNGGELVIQTELVTPGKDFFARYPDLLRGPLVCLSISDTGTGMSADIKAQIFEPFFTTKEKGKGTGLGLATVFGIIKQSGGEITLESEPGRGTTFRIYLPYVEAGISDKDNDKDKEQYAAHKANETILLVEDEESLRRLGVRLLRASGYTVIPASCGEEALEAAGLHGKPVDLLLTDVVMPGMSGRELARELERRKLVKRTLYMSGYTDDAIVRHGVLEPGIAFIYKPFTVEALSAKLRAVLDSPADQAKA